MMKLIMILFALILLTSCSQTTKKMIINNEKSFNLEISDSAAERAKGLMFRKNLDDNSGMLFIFPDSDRHSFWMKNTFIPLDIIWIDENLEIVYIYENAKPCTDQCKSIIPDKDAKYVLEINSGLAGKYNFKIGNRVEII